MRVSLLMIAGAFLLVLNQGGLTADLGAGASAFDTGDYGEARAQWQPLAEDGDARAQYNLALLYANGWGVNKDAIKAMRWFGRAAKRGNAMAQYNLALMRQTGNGVPTELSEAVYWYREAAEQGLVDAQNNLALMYIEGKGVHRDRAEGVRWLARAAAQSNAEAKANRSDLMSSLPQVAIQGSSVNVRTEPSRSATVRAQAGPASTVRLLEQGDKWSQVWLTGSDDVGWVANFLLGGLPEQPASDVEMGLPEAAPDNELAAVIPTAEQLPHAGMQAAPEPAVPPDKPDPSDRSDAPQKLTLSQPVGYAGAVDNARTADSVERMRVATPTLNVRARPSTHARLLTQLDHNRIVKVVAEQTGWRKIRLPGGDGTGWVAGFLLAQPD